ncbi:phage tail protein [Streptococcus ruminantium]|uniref:phage tail protein n=1 Tax=Streptococcus ruminantium TaxID=1917441 RepID=UPI0012DF62C5|nr:phage tail protein [Streptococcus ruminantium]
MILTIHDSNLQKVAFIDNDKQGTLNFYDDKWTRYLSKASSIFTFTVFKRKIQSDIAPYQTANALTDQSFVSFTYKGRTYLFSVMTLEENEQTITCTCKDLNLELTNEYVNAYKSDRARTFKEYCDVFGLLDYASLRIGINEISDQKRTLEWEGQDTKLNRILSLANKFDAEIDFEVKLNADGTIKDFVLNVYHEHDEKHQGVGKVRSDIILKKGKNIRSIKRKIDKTDAIVNAIRPTAQGENGETITIAGLGPWEIKNEDGVVEFFQDGEFLFAPISMRKYPSIWTNSTGNSDRYTRKDITVDTKSKEMLRTQAYKELKRSAYPSVSYEIDGYVDLEIGDTAKVYNGDFHPALLLEVRVSEQTISFNKPSSNKTVFDNIRALKNRLSSGIQTRWQEMIEAAQPYVIKVATDNGVVFKNSQGQSVVTPMLYRSGKQILTDVTWRWSLNGQIKTGMTYIMRGSDVADTATLTIAAYIGNNEVASDTLSFVNVADGANGPPGPRGDKGEAGPKGADGKTTYPHYAFADSQDGRTGFSLTDTGQRYQGYYSDHKQVDSHNPSDYRWSDRWAKIDVGGQNLFYKKNRHQGRYFNNTGVLVHSKDYDTSQFIELKAGVEYILQTWGTKGTWVGWAAFNQNDVFKRYETRYLPETGYLVEKITFPEATKISIGYDNRPTNLKIKLERGSVPTDWSIALEDLQLEIDSKADQSLTQEQLNALNEKSGLIQAELEAKASLDTVNTILKQIRDMKTADEATWAKVEKDMIAHLQRFVKIETNIGDQAQRWNAIDTFMQITNEGLSLGKADGSSSMLFSPEGRITMFSSGTPVMYVDKGVIHIENGIFSKTVQIGRFREEQYHLNPDMNVIRYVGGA